MESYCFIMEVQRIAFFILQIRHHNLHMVIVAAEVVKHTGGGILLGWPADEHQEYGWDCMITLPCSWVSLRICLITMYNRWGDVVLGPSVTAVVIPWVLSRSGVGVTVEPLPNAAHDWLRESVGDPLPLLTYTQIYHIYFPKVDVMMALLVDGCLGPANIRKNLRIHFVHHHM